MALAAVPAESGKPSGDLNAPLQKPQTARSAPLKLPAVFSDHMVLQRGSSVPLWGWAEPGEKIGVQLNGQTASAIADANGRWRLALDLSKQPDGPFDLTITGKTQIVIRDVLIGQVWLCSGQSNMEFPMREALDAPREIAASNNPLIRQFLVDRATALDPQTDLTGRWDEASPATTGRFSAVAYYFARRLQKELGVPIGIINSSYGGTLAEGWISIDAMRTDAELKKLAESQTEAMRQYYADLDAWEAKYNRVDSNNRGYAEGWALPEMDTADWKRVKVPGRLTEMGMPGKGVVWLRRDVELPPAWAGRQLNILLGHPEDLMTVYFNGEPVGRIDHGTSYHLRQNYSCWVPAERVHMGRNTIALRLVSQTGPGGFVDPKPINMVLEHINGGRVPLAGDWLAKTEVAWPPLEEAAIKALVVCPNFNSRDFAPRNVATVLYNAQINPLVSYRIAGALWYQGEGNTPRGLQYRRILPLLIQDWRSRWGQGDFPFYIVQLPNLYPKQSQPAESHHWTELREAQFLTWQRVPNTGLAVTIELGEADNVHPRDKREVGQRLALIALANTYGRDIEYSGPVYQSMAIEGNKVRIRFTHLGGGLVARALPETYIIKGSQTEKLIPPNPNSQLQGFAISGTDGKWVWANAAIEGDSVVVHSPAVAVPTAIRYAWADNPTCNLYNQAGLPAVPFRTDVPTGDAPKTSR